MHEAPFSPLLNAHERVDARLTDFAGWQMPLRFESDLAEHQAVRTKAGIFDLSHMGQVEVSGPGAAQLIDHSFVGLSSTMEIGRAKYTMMVAEEGGVLDDLIVYRLAEAEFLVIPNGVNRTLVVDELTRRGGEGDTAVIDHTLSRALIAVQGPVAAEVLQGFVDIDLTQLRNYRCTSGFLTVAARTVPTLVARTGYSGEDGFEVSISANDAEDVWEALAAVEQVSRCGLAARDSLRLEAGLPLYGNELSAHTTPYDVGMGRLVHLDHDFVGREALRKRSEGEGTALIGLVGEGRRAARAGASVLQEGEPIGAITSGILSPTLGYPIAMAVVTEGTVEGQVVDVDVRGRTFPMEVVALPFYRRPKTT